MAHAQIERKTAETQVRIELEPDPARALRIDTGIGFFDHMLSALLFHGAFSGCVAAQGDLAVDAHHTVEDVGICLGKALGELQAQIATPARYGRAAVPMDDALAEAVLDVSGRAYLVYRIEYPQAYAGTFDLALVREFFQALSTNAAITLHLIGHYAVNGHHLAEALFKAVGQALLQGYAPATQLLSTKGSL